MAAVTLDDLKEGYEGTLTFTDAWLKRKLAEALAMVDEQCPGVQQRLASGKLSQVTFTAVICDMVYRVVRNPDGFTDESEGNYSYGMSKLVASGDMWLSAKDKRRLMCPGAASMLPGTVSIGLDRGWGG